MAIIRKEDVKCTIRVILFFFFFLVEVGERRGAAERERERETTKNNLLRKCPGSKGTLRTFLCLREETFGVVVSRGVGITYY